MGCRAPSAPAPTQTASVQIVSASDAATVTDVRIPCQSIGGHLWYRIIVPRSAAGEQLPVLYLLHGGFGNPVDIQAHTDAVKQAVAHRLIVVTPDVGQSWYTNARHRQNARWEDAVAYDLVRDVESRFPALKGREHRGLAGVSMSGYGAVKLALKHPELYGYAASMAGAFDVTRRWPNILNPAQSWNEWMIFGFRAGTRRNEDVFAILPQAKSLQSVRWFLSCGSEDHFAADNRKLATLLHQRGAQVETFEAPGKHDWGPWNKALPELFRTAEESLR